MLNTVAAYAWSNSLVAVDLSTSHVAVAQGKMVSGKVQLSKAGLARLPEASDHRKTAGVLRRLLKQSGISTRRCASCYRGRGLVVKHYRYQGLTDDEIKSALRLEAEEALQTKSNLFSMDVLPYGPREDHTEGVVAALADDRLQSHLQLLQEASLVPAVVEVGCTAIANTYRLTRVAAERHPDECIGLLHLAGDQADVVLLYGNEHMYPRSLYSNSVAWSMVPDALAENLNEAILYFKAKLRAKPLDRVLVSGAATNMEQLCGILQERIERPVEIWNPLTLTAPSGTISRLVEEQGDQSSALAACVSLAIRTT